jgi:hypothetical protein
MMRAGHIAIVLGATVLSIAPAVSAETAPDLGPAALTGTEAVNGIRRRAHTLHMAMACDNELEFARRFAYSAYLGKRGEDPTTPFIEKDFATWPLTLMLGKAAVLGEAETKPAAGPLCRSRLGTKAEVVRDWAPLVSKRPNETAEETARSTAEQLVNRVYKELYAFSEGTHNAVCSNLASSNAAGEVFVDLTRSCLARQIRAVMAHPRHGPWHEEGGKVTPEVPGTSASKLTCLSEFLPEFSLFPSGVDGDWDMAVTDYTRLAHLLYAVRDSRVGLDVAAALEVLNLRFLTLRSSDEHGATARESYNLLFSCGNLPNQFGSAVDTVTGTGADPGLGQYNEDGRDAVEDTSFWEDLFRAFVVIVLFLLSLGLAYLAGLLIASLLGAAVAVAAVIVAVTVVFVAIVLTLGSIEETENHLLMQNSARYLKNKLMMAELSQQGRREQFDELAELNEELRIWLLKRMKRIADEDFVEYNSKPYGRLSHFALLNLIDFACDIKWDYGLSAHMQGADAACDGKDQAIVTSAAAVLDLSAAKAAVGSLDGRRLIPYRRLAVENQRYYDGRSLLDLVGGADTMLAALQVWTGQLQFAANQRVRPETFDQLVFYSTSHYRPDEIILDIAVNKAVARQQQYRHFTREAYASGNGWLITAGGTDERSAQGFKLPLGITLYFLAPVNDRGVGVPTTLMTRSPSVIEDGKPRPRSRVTDFLRFDGKNIDLGEEDDGSKLVSFSDNNCIAGPFACGLRLRYPRDFDVESCTRKIADRFVAIDSTRCFAMGGVGNDVIGPAAEAAIFIALYDHDGEWGFLEVAQQDAFGRSIDAFIAAVKSRNADHMTEWGEQDADDEITYVTTRGQKLEFTPEDEAFGADRRACGVVNHESGAHFTISNVDAAHAPACHSVGRRIVIDLDDEENPVRKAEGGAPLDDLF